MSEQSESPENQSYYQVRFDWGVEGATATAPGTDAIIWVDELGGPQQTPATDAAKLPGELANAATGAAKLPGELANATADAAVISGGIANAAAVAAWVIRMQSERGDRFRIAVVAAGERRSDGSPRFAVEDLLGAGAVIDALTAVGIDHCSPEAAAASAAYVGLRRATKHLIGASVSGRTLGSHHLDFTPSDEEPLLKDFAPGH